MYPMDFEEFLLAANEDGLIEMIKTSYETKKELIEIFHTRAIKYYLDYLLVGGMPQAVLDYVSKGNDISKFDKVIHSSIITAYIADMRKYTVNGSETIKINQIYDSIPKQLAKENTKFKYNIISLNANKRDYELPLDWLIASSLVYKANKLENIATPFKAYSDPNNFKIYLSDTGLLSTLANVSYKDILFSENNIFKGALTENYIAQTFKSKKMDLFYFKPNQNMEIDFICNINDNVIPIEIKAGTHTKSTSLNNYKKKYNPKYSIRISGKNFGYVNDIFSIPLYAVFCI
jgi:predicted AAA+ superfamily ATPase